MLRKICFYILGKLNKKQNECFQIAAVYFSLFACLKMGYVQDCFAAVFSVSVLDRLFPLRCFVDFWTLHLLLRIHYSDFIERGVLYI